jgi:hypothetical protein
MKFSMKSLALGLCMLALFGLPVVMQAQEGDANPPNKADLWVIHVKTGMAAEFEAAFTAHLAFRAEKGEPRAWNTYTVAIGDDLGAYGIRFCCVHWADVDKYVAWSEESGVDAHWNENVDQYVDSYEHYFSTQDFKNSNWPEGDTKFTLFGVTTWQVKQGADRTMNEAKAKLSSLAKEHGWPRHWAWNSRIGGSSTLAIVSPYENYAGMEPPEKSFAEFLTEHMDSPEEAIELLGSFSKSFKSSEYTVYRLREDLSMPSGDE